MGLCWIRWNANFTKNWAQRRKVLEHSFVLRHNKANKSLEEHFFICRLLDYDLSRRCGPEFSDPTRGAYIPEEIPLTSEAIEQLAIKTEALRTWLMDNLDYLRELAN